MDYSELIDALKHDDKERITAILRDMTPRLENYLKIQMGASREDAKDAVQKCFLQSLEVIREGRLNNPDKILTYLMTTCRNNYLKSQQKNRERNYDTPPSSHLQLPQQLRHILHKERFEILEECLDELSETYREFIAYWFEFPDSKAEDVAREFDITIQNTWTRKHRIIKRLNDCFKEKINL